MRYIKDNKKGFSKYIGDKSKPGSLLLREDWEGWLIHQRVMLEWLSGGTSMCYRNGLTRTS